MRPSYSQQSQDELLASVRTRRGWDFGSMNVLRQPVPWEYRDVVLGYLRSSDAVLDVGTHADVDGQSALASAASLTRSWPGTWTTADS